MERVASKNLLTWGTQSYSIWTLHQYNGWRCYYHRDFVASIKNSHLNLAVQNRDKIITLGAGARWIETTNSPSSGNDKQRRIPKPFRLIDDHDGRCVWLSVCIMIYLIDNAEGRRLAALSLFKDLNDKYNHLFFTKNKKAGKQTCQDLLIESAKDTSTKYKLKKIKNVPVKFKERERFILEEFDECCVTVLTDTGGKIVIVLL